MNFEVRKTTDLSPAEIENICVLFSDVFEGHLKNAAAFREEYLNTVWGYSLHGLMIDSGRIVGTHSMVPVVYDIGCEPAIWMFSGDTMVKKGYRDFVNLMDLLDLCHETVNKEYGIGFIFGFPNESSYPVFTKGFAYKEIGRLRTYVLPYRIGGIKHGLRGLNFLSVICSRIMLAGAGIFRNGSKVVEYPIDKDRSRFRQTRLKWFGGDYRELALQGGGNAVYKTMLYEGIRTAFIIDIDEVSRRNLNSAVRQILKLHRKEIDVVLYVGNLPFFPLSLVRIPRKYEPKNFYFIGKVLDKGKADKNLVLDIDNWNVNLSCYDLL